MLVGGRHREVGLNAASEATVAALIGAAVPVEEEPIDIKEAGLSQRDALLEVCDGAEIWRSNDGETFASVEVDGHPEHHPIKSQGFRDWMLGELARRYCNKGRPASATESAVRDARMGLEARAHHGGVRKDAPLRVARHRDRIYIDLGAPDWRAVEVAEAGWRLVDRAPVPILRARRTASFPSKPISRAGLPDLRDILGHLPDDDFILFVSWCLGALLPDGPYPILILGGEQGSGKSTLARLAQRLTDPVTGDLLQPPGDDRDLIAAARNNRVLAFDNFSGIRSDLADSLCRLATGSEIGGRMLYSNHDTATFSASRPLILNGIPDLAARGDLADRAIVLRLDAPATRITERDWAATINRVLPAAFGALLDALVAGLRHLNETETPDVRMADFARFVAAAEPALPWPKGAFMAAYQRNRGQAVAALTEGDLVATTVKNFMASRSAEWHGLVSSLFETLSNVIPVEARRSGDWPGNARWFSDRLRRAAPALRALGIDVQEKRDGHGVNVNIRKIASLATWSREGGSVPDDADVASDAISPVSDVLSRTGEEVAAGSDDRMLEAFEERAAIMEYDGGLTRAQAEEMATKDIEANISLEGSWQVLSGEHAAIREIDRCLNGSNGQ